MAWSAEQRRNASIIYRVGLNLGASYRDIQVAIMAAIVESGLRNVNYGDRDSLGLFQQRDAWGSRSQRLDPAAAAQMFFLGGHGGQQGLLDIGNRASRSMGSLAQDVQVSAYPGRYAEHQNEAGLLLHGINPAAGGVSGDGKGSAPTPPPVSPPDLSEVDGAGAITADPTGIGALTFDQDGNPLTPDGPLDALTFGMEPVGQLTTGGGGGGGGGHGGYDPMSHLYMPSADDYYAPSGGTGYTNYGGDTSANFQPDGSGFTPSGKVTKAASEYGLGNVQPELTNLVGVLGPKFDVNTVGGYRESAIDPNGHPAGLAADFMTSTPQGEALAAYAQKRARELGVDYIIWRQHIWSVDRADEGWRLMEDRGSPTQNHMDHVHINVVPGFVPRKPADASRSGARNAARWAQKFLGVPFKWGGEDATGMDGIGLVRQWYRHLEMDPPARPGFELLNIAEPLRPDSIEPGDVIAFPEGGGLTHIGLYLGNDHFLEASGPDGAVQLGSIAQVRDIPGIHVIRTSPMHEALNPFPNGTSSETPSRGGAKASPPARGAGSGSSNYTVPSYTTSADQAAYQAGHDYPSTTKGGGKPKGGGGKGGGKPKNDPYEGKPKPPVL